jgi:hypothetical protein
LKLINKGRISLHYFRKTTGLILKMWIWLAKNLNLIWRTTFAEMNLERQVYYPLSKHCATQPEAFNVVKHQITISRCNCRLKEPLPWIPFLKTTFIIDKCNGLHIFLWEKDRQTNRQTDRQTRRVKGYTWSNTQ